MRPQTVTLPPLDLRADVGAIDDSTRTIGLTFTTGADVVRFDWETGRRFIERLSMDPKHVRMQRLNAGAPLLDSHSAYTLAHQIGVVERATLEGKKGLADVRFSKRADVEPFYQDVRDKIIRNVSVGYRVHRFEELAQNKDGLPVRMAVDWEPYEISMVAMGADAGATVRAARDIDTNPCVIVRAATMDDADRLRRLRLAQAQR